MDSCTCRNRLLSDVIASDARKYDSSPDLRRNQAQETMTVRSSSEAAMANGAQISGGDGRSAVAPKVVPDDGQISTSSASTTASGGPIRKPDAVRIPELFDWLDEQEWAQQYYTRNGSSVIRIAVGDDTATADAQADISSAGFGDLIEFCSFGRRGACKYERCADANAQVRSDKSADHELRPGQRISSACEKSVAFSGSIAGSHLREIGLSVAHVFAEANSEEIFASTKTACARHLRSVDCLLMDPPRRGRITTDLCFLKIDDSVFSVRNEMYHREDGKDSCFAIKLLKDECQVGTSVFVIDENANVTSGTINSVDFRDKPSNLWRTLVIDDGQGRSITQPGDSGRPIIQFGNERNNGMPVKRVVGIAIGKWTHDDGTSATIANRLWDVLQAVGKNDVVRQCLTDERHAEDDAVMNDVDFVVA